MDKMYLGQGTNVYWLTPSYMIKFGVVEETWHDGVDINLLCSPNKTLINDEPTHEISFPTADEALQAKEKLFVEFQRVANLSDYENNLEKLDQVAEMWAKLYSVPEDRLEKEKDMIKSLKNFDNLEFRIADKQLQFKEWNKKRWTGISYE